ncbi:MAG: cobalt/nickel transport system permease protein [Desulfobacteraceae bacterium Eth-SRB1]|nr:MAG: cobalt/nickel transport system permease protein [Desulfobacteraceae bacterium Eth-SRB1]
MIIEEISGNDSFIYHLDPRVKIIIAFLFSVIVAVSNRFVVLIAALAVSIIILFSARIQIKEVFKRLIPVNTLLIFLWLFLPFTFAGEHLFFSIGFLTGTREGVLFAFRITIKSNAIMLMLISLTASTPIFTIGHAMHQLGMPKKLIQLFLFTYRYLHVIYGEYARLINSMKIRGFKPKTDLHTYKSYAYLVGMLLVKGFDRSQRVHNAMMCRGFSGKLYSLSEFSIKGADILAFAFMATIILILGILEWTQIT